jgi:hypothetical protein
VAPLALTAEQRSCWTCHRLESVPRLVVEPLPHAVPHFGTTIDVPMAPAHLNGHNRRSPLCRLIKLRVVLPRLVSRGERL